MTVHIEPKIIHGSNSQDPHFSPPGACGKRLSECFLCLVSRCHNFLICLYPCNSLFIDAEFGERVCASPRSGIGAAATEVRDYSL
jgi:hypothetical protein